MPRRSTRKFYGFIIRQKNKLVLLPIFFALGFYLYWALDGTTLTLGWVLGGLVLFILGLWIKEKLFHYLSLVTVGRPSSSWSLWTWPTQETSIRS
jgi:hypothetical protein